MPFEIFRKPETKDIPVPYPPFPQARAGSSFDHGKVTLEAHLDS